MRRAFVAALLVLTGVLAFAPAAHAQTGEETIDRYRVAIDVGAAGRLQVSEVIDYDFGTNYRHGIYRYIPVRFHYDSKYDRVYKISNIHVTGSADTPSEIKVSDNSNNKVIRIGDPHTTITGRHQYTITYDVRGAFNHFADHDELYWNAIPTNWNPPVVMHDVEVVVHTPVPTTQLACFAGPEHSTLPCPTISGAGTTDESFGATDLAPADAFTIVAGVPVGSVGKVAPILDERWAASRAFAATTTTVPVAAVLTALIALLVGRMLWRRGRDRRLLAAGGEAPVPMFDHDATPVQYRPPDDLRPAQVGVLVDERADPLDVTATIIDLGVRGYLAIEQIPDKGIFSKGDWKLTRKKPDDDQLLPYERKLIDALFDDGDEVLLSDLKHHFSSTLHEVQDDLYKDCVSKRWFLRRPDLTRGLWLGLGIAVFIVGAGVVGVVAAFSHAGLAVLPLVLAGVLVIAVHNRMPARTGAGTATLGQVLGFRRFITTAETERMQFAEEQGIFAKYLPYAIVFHATKQWAKRFAGLDASSPAMAGMGWYISPYPFNPIAFGSSMHDFTITTAGTISAAPPSASGGSGFGGGGFAGGGGGGGGGGSW